MGAKMRQSEGSRGWNGGGGDLTSLHSFLPLCRPGVGSDTVIPTPDTLPLLAPLWLRFPED